MQFMLFRRFCVFCQLEVPSILDMFYILFYKNSAQSAFQHTLSISFSSFQGITVRIKSIKTKFEYGLTHSSFDTGDVH